VEGAAQALEGPRLGLAPRARRVLSDYAELTKPKVQSLLLLTTIATMYVAGDPSPLLVALTCLGGYLSAGGAGAVNHWYDRDIDARMARTASRPVPSGRVSPQAALAFGCILAGLSFLELSLAVNVLAASLSFAGFLVYVFLYTVWLKRRTPQNIVIGGAAGAVPVLVGWAAVTDSLSWAPVVLFAIIFIWTPPHFWSLAVRYKEDYAAADVPMLPVVASMKRTTREIVLYTVVLVAVSLLFGPVAHLGLIYLIAAALLGAGFLFMTARLWRLARTDRATGKEAMRVFSYSITYLTVLFVAMAGDVLITNHLH
jgi:protoheme IX farnesyltransferase